MSALATERQVGDTALGAIACTGHATPLGEVMLAASAGGMVRVAFPEHADFDALAARARTRRGLRAARAHLEHGITAIDAYFAGAREQVDETVDWAIALAAGAESLAATRRVRTPRPARTTARLVRRAVRHRFALGTNPMPFLLPCHRVTRLATGELPLTTSAGWSGAPRWSRSSRVISARKPPCSAGSAARRSYGDRSPRLRWTVPPAVVPRLLGLRALLRMPRALADESTLRNRNPASAGGRAGSRYERARSPGRTGCSRGSAMAVAIVQGRLSEVQQELASAETKLAATRDELVRERVRLLKLQHRSPTAARCSPTSSS